MQSGEESAEVAALSLATRLHLRGEHLVKLIGDREDVLFAEMRVDDDQLMGVVPLAQGPLGGVQLGRQQPAAPLGLVFRRGSRGANASPRGRSGAASSAAGSGRGRIETPAARASRRRRGGSGAGAASCRRERAFSSRWAGGRWFSRMKTAPRGGTPVATPPGTTSTRRRPSARTGSLGCSRRSRVVLLVGELDEAGVNGFTRLERPPGGVADAAGPGHVIGGLLELRHQNRGGSESRRKKEEGSERGCDADAGSLHSAF